MMPIRKSVLVLGATGRTGLECIRELSNHKPKVHAFCRDPSKLSHNDQQLCTSIIQGDAKSVTDIEYALRESQADVVIVCIGNEANDKKSDIRTASALTLSSAMKKAEFYGVNAIIVSSAGAGTSKINVGLGIGHMISFHLRHILRDHDGQEMAFASPVIRRKTIIVRPTGLTDHKPKGKLVTFRDDEKAPTIETDRSDLAAWIAAQACSTDWDGGRIVNITSARLSHHR